MCVAVCFLCLARTTRTALSCVAVCCSVLRCVAVRCNVCCRVYGKKYQNCPFLCCSVLQYQYVAMCVALYVAVCCSLLQSVAVCCSLLQSVAVFPARDTSSTLFVFLVPSYLLNSGRRTFVRSRIERFFCVQIYANGFSD